MPAKRHLTDQQIVEIVELFKAGEDSVSLGKAYGVSDSAIRKWLKKSGITETDSRIKLSPEQIEEAKQYYAAGLSTIELAECYGTTQQTVATALQRNGVVLRPRGAYRTCTVREDAFDVLTPEAAYWLGMMATDGTVTGASKKAEWIALRLKLGDLAHVERFRTFLGSTHSIGLDICKHPTDPTRECPMARLAIRSKRLIAALDKYGITPRKTYTLEVKGGVENMPEFWAGCLDGDGSIGLYDGQQNRLEPSLRLVSASEKFMNQYYAFLKANGVGGTFAVQTEKHPNPKATAPLYVVHLGVRQALDAVALLYTCGVPLLDRKRKIATEMLRLGAQGKLVGTVQAPWYSERVEAWLKSCGPCDEITSLPMVH